jgi:two-component system OmpR family response regulator
MVDLTRRQIWREDVHISLTPNEGKLMKVFLENPGQVFSHQELVIKIHGYEAMAWEATEVLRPLISRLRRKLSSLPGGDQWIKSIRGTGYVFDKPPIQ